MLGAAAAIVAQAPRCQPLPAKAWWELGALYRAPPKAFGGNLKGVEQRLGYLKEKLQVGGLILGPLAPQKKTRGSNPPPEGRGPRPGSPQDLSALLQAAKDKGLKDALRHWLKEEIAGVFLDGIEELPPSVVAEWRNLTEEKPSPSGVTRVLVGGTALQDPQAVPAVPGGLRLLLGPFLQPLEPRPERESPEGALRSLLGLLGSNASIGGLGWSQSLLGSNASIGGLGWSVSGVPLALVGAPRAEAAAAAAALGLPGTPVLSYGDELGLGRTNDQQLPPMPWELIDEPKKSGTALSPPSWSCAHGPGLAAGPRALAAAGEALRCGRGAAVALLRRWDQSERFLLLLNPQRDPPETLLGPEGPPGPPPARVGHAEIQHRPPRAGGAAGAAAGAQGGPHQGLLLSFPYSPQ
ncbi:amino acid transporter heavy chain SLC3A2 [Zonotrichia albicollis]|uniref:amino acid transporter heavy chain SLC3A2 n=1 Tax=Zonotrichia albicollis TaxID=44394 RepID=UPI003D811B91